MVIITIDGPAGTGKTTIARKVAEKLRYQYFDTGAMYRAFTYFVLTKGLDLENLSELTKLLENFDYEIKKDGEQKRYFIAAEDVTEKIRSAEITKKVSEVSANPMVREALVAIQRKFGKGGNAVFEGRDMGTIVFPAATLKVFLTARPAVRAERRYHELKDKFASSKEETLQDLLERDFLDSNREVSPLKQADDAHLIDTSDLSIDEVVERVVALVPRS